jgi:hypothetical protein
MKPTICNFASVSIVISLLTILVFYWYADGLIIAFLMSIKECNCIFGFRRKF